MKKYFERFASQGALFTLALSLLLLWFYFGPIIQHANHIYFDKSGDGLQSYYTTLYHIKYDTDATGTFTGMNYPYGRAGFLYRQPTAYFRMLLHF